MTTKMANIRGLPSSMNPSDGSGTCPTVQWIGNSGTGFLRLIDQTRLPTEFVEIDCRDVPAVWEAIKATSRPRCAGDRHRGGIWRGVRRTGARPERSGFDSPRSGRCHGILAHKSTDGRQPVLGSRPDGRCRGWGQSRRWPGGLGSAAIGGQADRRRGSRDVSCDRPAWRRACAAGAWDLDALQCRRTGYRGLRNSPGRCVRGP